MDLLDLAILALRLALVGVLYAFLVVVLRAAGRGLQAARPEPGPAPARRANVELQLIVLEPASSGLTAGQVLVAADGTTLGRGAHAELLIADSAVSAEHARVSRVGREWMVVDLGSTNGTLVNDVPVNGQTRLKHGDVLALGGVRFTVALRPVPQEVKR